MTAKIKRVYDIYLKEPFARSGRIYKATVGSEDAVEEFMHTWFAKDWTDKDELEVRTVWRKYYEIP